jgi:hypothetical protein
LASLHAFVPKARPESPALIYMAVLFGALLGGFAVAVMPRQPLVIGGYSFAKLLGALVFAEAVALVVRKPPRHIA